MTGMSLETRVSVLERQVNELATRDDVRALAEQILQLGLEMREGFSALREEIRAGDEETRRVLREEIRAGDEETRRVLREEIRAGDEETRRGLEVVIGGGDEETRRYMRVLYEDVIERISRLSG